MSHLLDTNIVIFFFKGKYGIEGKMEAVGIENCFISEITLAELKYGALFSQKPKKHIEEIEKLLEFIRVIPITSSIDLYAQEKARLRRAGMLIDDFDLMIGCTAISNDLTLVTNNTRHFNRLQGLKLEDWTK
ncbi:MAG: type II toxin-antitoxin system VapC family toxin [Lewinellaceae bacterium]|nr:type II toxin-antitoxin system VapC family toxin [Phaeodactylibacter sp.]MCB9041588.1 type II toxin-antitoxin system VapC family toxin [Lewinellaceae bacterium]